MKHPNNFKHLFAKKNLGQHFLTSRNAVDTIVDHALLDKDDNVLEIGPGLGILTEKILSISNKLVVVEKDKRMLKHLETEFNEAIKEGRLQVIEEDAIILDLKKYFKCENIKVISNLPYNVSIPILFNLFNQKDLISQMTLMFQKEVAERIIAEPGSKKFGVLSVNTQIEAEIYKILDLNPQDFFPPPKVNSTVLNFNFNYSNKYEILDKDIFQVFLKAAFFRRRRKIINSLESSGAFKEIDFNKVFDLLKIDPKKRAEALSLHEFCLISNQITSLLEE